MNKKALLVIDIQRDYFQGGQCPLPNMQEASQRASDAIQWFRETAQPIIYIRHIELDPTGTFLLKGTPGAEIHPSVAPRSNEPVIEKNFPNSFRDTELAEKIAKLAVDEVVICGAMSNMCIDATARAAVDLGFTCTIIHDACEASEIEFCGKVVPASDVHNAFMGAFASAYGRVVSVEELMAGG